jgi:hypothetical protein
MSNTDHPQDRYCTNPESQNDWYPQKATMEALKKRLDTLVQYNPDNEGASSVMGRVVMDTAESYRIATLLYLHCSIFG